MTARIVYQGEAGAYSHLACREHFPDMEPWACQSFSEAFARVRSGEADLAMIPVENTVAGRVSDIYHLLPEGGLSIIAERYQPIHHQLLALPGVSLSDITTARSHPMALGQVRDRLTGLGIAAIADVDTAAAARKVAERGDRQIAAVASRVAAEVYGLQILAEDIEDSGSNTTRFIVLSRTPHIPDMDGGPVVSSFVFRTRSVPSALYKALGGFASNGLNLTKLESYMIGGGFTAAQFYVDVEGHPDSDAMRHALEELDFFTEDVRHLGTYPADGIRAQS
ncbi:prephenate dehydratase [Algimonas porphyrae]|uniref:prephenate dehydratase n=1 Tax=Algimonas porphyrae TaxID=1128113 RepID=A0ABQ5UZV7_9PROT|nr:prephenate dehydratase [Algimonas porphyrae]GLQ19964.1 prephenate dehydratase [Algimonas porphyrae]